MLLKKDNHILNCTVFVLSNSDESRQNAIDGGADYQIQNLKDLSQIDGAIVAVKSVDHYKVITNILDHFGPVPIYCEKPLTVKAFEAENLYLRCPNNLFVMHKWRYHKGILALADLAKKATLGRLLGIKLIRNNWSIPHTDVDCTWILLPHDLSIVLEFLGYIPPVKYARYDKTPLGIKGLIGLLSDNNCWVSVEISERYPKNKREISLYFEKGIAQLKGSATNQIELYETEESDLKSAPQAKYIEFDNTMPLLDELTAFIAFIQGTGKQPKSSAKEGFEVISRIEELREVAYQND